MYATVNGGYCEWSPWQRCFQPNDDITGGCLCRMRSCDCPQPLFGVRYCEPGLPQLQVTNCTGTYQFIHFLQLPPFQCEYILPKLAETGMRIAEKLGIKPPVILRPFVVLFNSTWG